METIFALQIQQKTYLNVLLLKVQYLLTVRAYINRHDKRMKDNVIDVIAN